MGTQLELTFKKVRTYQARAGSSACVTGDVAAIVKMLVDAGATVQDCGYTAQPTRMIRVGDDAEYRAAMATVRNGDADLCKVQLQQNAAGYRHYTLSTNIYGWAVGDMMDSNINGGRFAMTARGATLEDSIRFGCQAVSGRRNRVFEFFLTAIPVDVQEALAAVGLE